MKSTKNRIFFSLFFLLSFSNLACAKIEVVLGNAPLDGNPNIALGTPVNNKSEIIISRDQYVISYNKEKRSPNWIAWKLENFQIGSSGRTNNFAQDADLEEYLKTSSKNQHAVNPTEYKGSCFDRGHQIPSADRTDSTENNQMTFAMTNMVPQTPYLNRGMWKNLEQYTRDLVQKEGKRAYVIAGPIYDKNFGAIGPNKDIPVPSKEFKVIIVLDANQSPSDINKNTQIISVIMPNIQADGTSINTESNGPCKPILAKDEVAPTPNDWQKYKTSLAEIEKLSGLTILAVKEKLEEN